MHTAVFKQLEERFKAPVIEAYAMTENSHQMTSNQLPPGKRKPGSVGQGTGTHTRHTTRATHTLTR
jgi:acyl-CoA synthetase (AMP-forming)/AMP-acid ligase II